MVLSMRSDVPTCTKLHRLSRRLNSHHVQNSDFGGHPPLANHHRKTIGKWWFNGIQSVLMGFHGIFHGIQTLWDIPSGSRVSRVNVKSCGHPPLIDPILPVHNLRGGSSNLGLQCGAPQLCLLAYKPHENYSYLRTINHSDIGVMFTNFANELGHHLVMLI